MVVKKKSLKHSILLEADGSPLSSSVVFCPGE